MIALRLRTCRINPRQVKQYWKSEMRFQSHKTRDAVDRPSGESSLLGDPGAKYFCGKRGISSLSPDSGDQIQTFRQRSNLICPKMGSTSNYCPESEFNGRV